MNRTHFLLMVVILAGILFNPVQAASAYTPETFPVELTIESSLQNASLQITVIPSDPEGKTITGIGTLVAYKGQVFIFTHNCWGSIQHWDRVYFSNAKGEPLLELYGRDVDALVVFQDQGNLVLRSPLSKTLPAAHFGEMGTVRPGDKVTIAYLGGKNKDTIRLVSGHVKKVGEQAGVPIYQLAILNGEAVGPCDLGGGVWHDDGFIGTLWQVQLDDHWSLKRLIQLRSIQEMNAAQALLEMLDLQRL
jgi:hypothetical protein